MNRLKMSIVFLVSFLAYYGGADDHASSYAGMDLSARVGLQYEVCQLREGKTLADANALTEQAGREFERLGMDLGIIMLNPMFDHGDANNLSADYVIMVFGSIPAFGSGWDLWGQSKNAQKVMSLRAEIGDCHFKFNHAVMKHADVAAMERSTDRLYEINWCTAKPGITPQQMKAKHDTWLNSNKSNFSSIAWSIIFPRLGQANAPGQYAHMFVYNSAAALMANQEWLANGGGWAGVQDYYNSYADCSGPSVWTGNIAYRPSN